MSRGNAFQLWFPIAVALLAVWLTNVGRVQALEKPNIIVILADDLGYGDLSSYGGWIPTPNLDALAHRGVRLTDFHSSGAVCSPTRAGFMTGLYQQRVGIPNVVTAKGHRDKGLSPRFTTIAEVLKKAGYSTAIFGKWHLGYDPKYNPIHQGFDRFTGYVSGNVDYFSHLDQTFVYDWWKQDQRVEEQGYTTHLITRHAVDFIQEEREQPFFLYVAYEAVHAPYQGPNDSAVRLPNSMREQRKSKEEIKIAYQQMAQEMDKGIGEMLQAIEKRGIAEQTLVFFFSDNGANPNGSNGKLKGHKGTLWEGGHRVPAFACWPGKIPAGRTVDQLAISLDLFPTLVEVAGAEVPSDVHLDGESLLNTLTGNRQPFDRTLYWRHGTQRAVRQGSWKLVVEAGRTGNQRVSLFDLATDLQESTDLSSQQREKAASLREKLEQWEKEVGPDQFGS